MTTENWIAIGITGVILAFLLYQGAKKGLLGINIKTLFGREDE